MIADTFNLTLSSPTNSCPTRYSDMAGESNSIIDLMFLYYSSSELDQHSIIPESQLLSDHTPLSVVIPLFEEVIQMSKLSLAPKSKQESVFIIDVILKFKNLDMTNIKDIINLEWVVKQLGMIINQVWTKTQKDPKNPSIPSNGGQKIAAILLIITEHQEASRIRRNSRRVLETPRDPSSMTKFKKSQIRVMIHRSWWTGSREVNSPPLKPSTIMNILASPSTACGMHSTYF